MRIHLVSEDPELYRLCRNALVPLALGDFEFVRGRAFGPEPSADLYIWDYRPESPPDPSQFTPDPGRNIFLVAREELESFWQDHSSAVACVLLKPVNPAALGTFLKQALARTPQNGPDPPAPSELEREKLLQCLLQASLRLQEYDQDRTNFLARALHDFRAPLTAVNGYCGLLLGQKLGPLTDPQSEVLQRVQRSVKRLSRLASGMFQLSLHTPIRRDPEMQLGSIEDCIEHAVKELLPIAEHKRINVTLQLDPSLRPLWFDASQIEQVMANLLDNACRFTPKGGLISVCGFPFMWDRRCNRMNGLNGMNERRMVHVNEPNAFRVEIRDSGPGIDAERLDRVFDEYTSYGGDHDRSGAGLGLAICRMIISAHYGRIWAESNGGEGAVFSFVLPFSQPEAAPVCSPTAALGLSGAATA